ncbi:hypothetical protein [Enterococcus casseliflavus]|uniref:hypothetical protein n=1 Tax=Enterococcus casseliflavus TaxID=37734 RepID=UPI0017838942|nr:hypothetical protein [Enterococcus casseliflavus]QOG31588.1 hypothetical protein EGM182_12565 [Enterococcus casseliflavus]
MDQNNDNLTPRDYLNLVVEAGIGAVPYVGGPLQTLYFGAQNEKRFKRIESFYNELNEKISELDSLILGEHNSDQLIGIVETIHDEVEKSKSADKIVYFVNSYKNLLLNSTSPSIDMDELFVNILSELTNFEITILTFLFKNKGRIGGVAMQGVDPILIAACLSRLSDLGLVNKHLESITLGGPGTQQYNYSISNVGINFCYYILQ